MLPIVQQQLIVVQEILVLKQQPIPVLEMLKHRQPMLVLQQLVLVLVIPKLMRQMLPIVPQLVIVVREMQRPMQLMLVVVKQ